jgi:hypothetical protein
MLLGPFAKFTGKRLCPERSSGTFPHNRHSGSRHDRETSVNISKLLAFGFASYDPTEIRPVSRVRLIEQDSKFREEFRQPALRDEILRIEAGFDTGVTVIERGREDESRWLEGRGHRWHELGSKEAEDQDQIVVPHRQRESIDVSEDALDVQFPAARLLLKDRKGCEADVNGMNRVSPGGREESVTTVTACKIESEPPAQEALVFSEEPIGSEAVTFTRIAPVCVVDTVPLRAVAAQGPHHSS